MIEKAIEKLKAEIVKSNDPCIQVVGEFLLQHLQDNHSNAEKIMQEGKTIEKSFEEMIMQGRICPHCFTRWYSSDSSSVWECENCGHEIPVPKEDLAIELNLEKIIHK